ncbi:hypothetical protein [Flavobacterium pectinovorum]|uniref:Uncharacterized protein n=1 Tax=Flavobacterium pectinovorum TaxID=29533 RepID=A0A502EQA7_9FLAO|nr:hypothetical protein [Flavobacterium pectinovorum]TPG39995.1 hypothetical protein EAH81_11895 [Flavobacterium pectinovorum]
MKKIIILNILILLLSCNEKKNDPIKPQKKKLELVKEITNGNYYFDFDEIEYYNIDLSEEWIMNTWDKNKKTQKEERLISIIMQNTPPKSIDDIAFLSYIEDIGFKKQKIFKNKIEKIKDIFRFKQFNMSEQYACMAIYRDILVFKKENKIVGIAKICFGCKQNRIVGTKVNTDQFGQKGDYKKLYNILQEK